jgi:hypothetical protein
MQTPRLLIILIFSSLLCSSIPNRSLPGILLGTSKQLDGLQGMQDCLAGMMQAAHKGP